MSGGCQFLTWRFPQQPGEGFGAGEEVFDWVWSGEHLPSHRKPLKLNMIDWPNRTKTKPHAPNIENLKHRGVLSFTKYWRWWWGWLFWGKTVWNWGIERQAERISAAHRWSCHMVQLQFRLFPCLVLFWSDIWLDWMRWQDGLWTSTKALTDDKTTKGLQWWNCSMTVERDMWPRRQKPCQSRVLSLPQCVGNNIVSPTMASQCPKMSNNVRLRHKTGTSASLAPPNSWKWWNFRTEHRLHSTHSITQVF